MAVPPAAVASRLASADGAAELEERLRQSESPMRAAVLTLRNWVLPFFAAWALLVPVLGVEDPWYLRLVETGLLFSLAVAGWQVLRWMSTRRNPAPMVLLSHPCRAIRM